MPSGGWGGRPYVWKQEKRLEMVGEPASGRGGRRHSLKGWKEAEEEFNLSNRRGFLTTRSQYVDAVVHIYGRLLGMSLLLRHLNSLSDESKCGMDVLNELKLILNVGLKR